jgi:hypothetical protein
MDKKYAKTYYIDRDTDTAKLANKMLKEAEPFLNQFLLGHHNRLQGREPGEYFTVDFGALLRDGGLEYLTRFYKGAVLQYYYRQSRDYWGGKFTTAMGVEVDKELKKETGFVLYDDTGIPTGEVNSTKNYKTVTAFSQWLNVIKEAIFEPNGYLFPDSKHYKALEKAKGRHAAKVQVFNELKTHYKNLN